MTLDLLDQLMKLEKKHVKFLGTPTIFNSYLLIPENLLK